jgi:hypothetical protein
LVVLGPLFKASDGGGSGFLSHRLFCGEVMTTNLHDKMLAAIDAYFSASDAVEEEVAENLLLDVRDEILKHKLAEQPAQQAPDYAWPTIADYEKEVGFKVNEAFKAAWTMARTTNDLFDQMGSDT